MTHFPLSLEQRPWCQVLSNAPLMSSAIRRISFSLSSAFNPPLKKYENITSAMMGPKAKLPF